MERLSLNPGIGPAVNQGTSLSELQHGKFLHLNGKSPGVRRRQLSVPETLDQALFHTLGLLLTTNNEHPISILITGVFVPDRAWIVRGV